MKVKLIEYQREMTGSNKLYTLSLTLYHLHNQTYNNKHKVKKKYSKKFQDCLMYVHQARRVLLVCVRQVLLSFKECLLRSENIIIM